MAQNSSQKTRMIERRKEVWSLRLQGRTEDSIADELGVCRRTIIRDLNFLIRRATQSLDEEVRRERVFQYAQLQMVYREAFTAWLESKKMGGQIVERKIPPSKSNKTERTEITITKYKQTGDPAYLTLALRTLEDIRKLFGLDSNQDDWESELERAGLNPDEIFEAMVQSTYAAIRDKEPDPEVT